MLAGVSTLLQVGISGNLKTNLWGELFLTGRRLVALIINLLMLKYQQVCFGGMADFSFQYCAFAKIEGVAGEEGEKNMGDILTYRFCSPSDLRGYLVDTHF